MEAITKTHGNAINNYESSFKGQRWMVAHNGWNTKQDPPNQVKTITQLLDYGVRGLALDVHPDGNEIVLKHGLSSDSQMDWQTVCDEIKDWLDKNTSEIVSLFFESYLPGPTDSNPDCLLATLDSSLQQTGYYKTGKALQTQALSKSLTDLAAASHRLFAFIEKTPDEGPQELMPEMPDVFAENMYGDASLDVNTWTDLRNDPVDSNYGNPFTFMNHFGNAPTQSERARNKVNLIQKHAKSFLFAYGGRYPNFISLDVINWERTTGVNANAHDPIKAVTQLKFWQDVQVTDYKWDSKKGTDDYDINLAIYPHVDQPIQSFTVETGQGQGITKIIGKRGAGKGIDKVQVYNHPGYGIVNLRYHTIDGGWSNWLTEFERPAKENDYRDGNLATHIVKNDWVVGYSCRLESGRGVTDFAIAYPVEK